VKQLVHRRARHGYALSLEGLFQPVDRRVIGALGDSEVGEERGAILPLLDDLGRARCRDNEAIATAAKHFLDMFDAKEARRHELPHAGLLPVAQRVELRVATHLAATLVVRNFVIAPNSWSLGFGRGAFPASLQLLFRRRRSARLDAGHLRLLAARAEHRLLQLRVLVLQLGEPIGQIGDDLLQHAVVVHLRYDHRPGLIILGDPCRSPCCSPGSIEPDGER
jgi:hypothetical protein